MSNTQRPTLARKDTRKSREARQAALEQGVRIKVADAVYEVRLGDITPVLARRFRKEVGSPFSEVMDELETGRTDIDSIGAVIWMAQLLRGDEGGFDEVEFGYGDIEDLEVELAEGEAEDEGPEA